ncbi:MAG: phytanoyl-CoA dioxygenase family protein [Armatimonadetes bacterium]|nr:phytanoyl-CoA dioxygenase family protein [Anaerolineae bacterium]
MLDQPLTSNGFTVSPEHVGWLVPTNPDQPRAALWEQYQAQGYLWLQGLLDRDAVLAFRRRVFTAFVDTGLLMPHTDPIDGIFSGETAHTQVHPNKVLMEVVRWASFEAFCLAQPIIDFYESFLEGAVYLHKRKILRYTRCQESNSTGPHYDLVYLRGGTDRICTSWIPIGDVPVEMGGLAYLEHSHIHGRAMEADFRQRSTDLPAEERISAYNKHMSSSGWLDRNLDALATKFNSRWLVADYQCGDMVVHGPYTIHAATSNVDSGGRIRLSADIRYQLVGDEIDVRWNNHWSLDDML